MGDYDAAISAAAAVADTAINASTQAAGNKKQRAWATEQNNLQWERQKEMWNMTNAYNEAHSSPSYMMQRYKDAGLNPWLIYGQPNKVEASNMNAPTAAQPGFTPVKSNVADAVQKYLGAKLANKQLEIADAEIQSKNAATQQALAATAATNQDTEQKAELFGGSKILQQSEIEGKAYSNQKILSEIDSIGVQMQKSNQEIANMKTNVAKQLMEIKTLQKQGKLQDAELEAKQLANEMFRATMPSKIDAENAYNQLMRNTAGMGKAGISQMPGLIIGAAMRLIQENFGKNKPIPYKAR